MVVFYVFAIFVQEEINGLWSSSNYCSATIFIFVVLLSWTELVLDEARVELADVKFLLFPYIA